MTRLPAIPCVALLALIATGCSANRGPATQPAGENAFPFSLTGLDTNIQFDFNVHPAITVPYKLEPGELCYIEVGPAIIVCGQEGSSLRFAHDESITLIDDNPLWRIQPASTDPSGLSMVQMYGTIFLIAGSIDRLPAALDEYTSDNEGRNRGHAIAIAKSLIDRGGAKFPAAARGGTFAVSLSLTPSGRNRLKAMVHAADVEAGVFLVQRRTTPSPIAGTWSE